MDRLLLLLLVLLLAIVVAGRPRPATTPAAGSFTLSPVAVGLPPPLPGDQQIGAGAASGALPIGTRTP